MCASDIEPGSAVLCYNQNFGSMSVGTNTAAFQASFSRCSGRLSYHHSDLR